MGDPEKSGQPWQKDKTNDGMMPQTRQNAITQYNARHRRWSVKTYAIGQAL
jgi:hypothetical protein